MKKYFFFFLLTSVMGAFAQSDRNVEDGLFKVNAFLPGASYEVGTGKNTSFNFDLFFGPFLQNDIFGGTRFGILPGVQAEFRYYNNFGRRISKGKKISGNSGNYVGVVNQFYLGNAIIGDVELDSSYYNIIGLVYGIQRTRPKGFYWAVSFGPGVGFGQFDLEPSIFVDAKLGWVISKRK